MVIEMFYYFNNILKGMFPSQLEKIIESLFCCLMAMGLKLKYSDLIWKEFFVSARA